jgi:hypothetical protein
VKGGEADVAENVVFFTSISCVGGNFIAYAVHKSVLAAWLDPDG